MLPFNYHHLYYFYMVATEGSISNAAKKLRLSQPTLSAQLKELEFFWNKQLFKRKGRSVVLTEDGEYVLSYAKTIFDLGQDLADSLYDRKEKGRLGIQIGISTFVPCSLVQSILNFILDHSSFTKASITIIEKDFNSLLEDLHTHHLDLILNDYPHKISVHEKTTSHLIAKIPLFFCGSQKWLTKCQNIPQDLEKVPLIIPTSQSYCYNALQEYFTS